ncbi:hypothetical protein ADN00_13360 [Ornatilinea apprima]|uniref:VTC domain-containing protein n=1 Tax=Ornatilinea apprima TaxID=1134406 RepID=A0A0P6X673_9CHLR|nr:hypothetical protein ADN00_13360 [Ornatilinea apprima]
MQTYTSTQWLNQVLNAYSPITLKEMDSVALLNRIDTKFVFSMGRLYSLLAALRPLYRVLSVQGQRLNHYRTLYFDTPAFDLYRLHVNGRADRFKVRSREYVDSQLSFLEVKHKTRKDRTIKDRISTPAPLDDLTPESEQWLDSVLPFDSRSLQPKVWNTFTRVTLVSNTGCERVTLDTNLVFSNAFNEIRLDGIVIAEVKLDSRSTRSPFLTRMQDERIHPQGFSKYVIGASLLYDHLKKNALKSKLILLNRMTQGF